MRNELMDVSIINTGSSFEDPSRYEPLFEVSWETKDGYRVTHQCGNLGMSFICHTCEHDDVSDLLEALGVEQNCPIFNATQHRTILDGIYIGSGLGNFLALAEGTESFDNTLVERCRMQRNEQWKSNDPYLHWQVIMGRPMWLRTIRDRLPKALRGVKQSTIRDAMKSDARRFVITTHCEMGYYVPLVQDLVNAREQNEYALIGVLDDWKFYALNPHAQQEHLRTIVYHDPIGHARNEALKHASLFDSYEERPSWDSARLEQDIVLEYRQILKRAVPKSPGSSQRILDHVSQRLALVKNPNIPPSLLALSSRDEEIGINKQADFRLNARKAQATHDGNGRAMSGLSRSTGLNTKWAPVQRNAR